MTSHFTSATDVRHHLDHLLAERSLADAQGLLAVDAYRSDLDSEIAVVRSHASVTCGGLRTWSP